MSGRLFPSVAGATLKRLSWFASDTAPPEHSQLLLFTLSRRAISPREVVKMMPLHQMPAANPEPERLDEAFVKTIQTKVNNKLDPAVPVRTHTPSRAAVPCGSRAQHEPHRQPSNLP